MKLTDEQRYILTGKVELIDYLLHYYCKCELSPEVKLHLKNLRYDFKTKIDADTITDRNAKIES